MSVCGFLEWNEQFVSQERGNRVVHYYLKDTNGESVLAVVGTERSVRHMVYVVADEFLQYGSEKSVSSGFKWRSRREVVDWLTSLLSKQRSSQGDSSRSPKNDLMQALRSPDFSINGLDASGALAHPSDHMNRLARNWKGQGSDILWSGDSWICGKQLKHYPSFCRNGTKITIHSFVFVMAKEENRYLAYLEDMYEDRKGQKKVRVRWFHDTQEVKRAIALLNCHPREVFITPYAQVISVECVDGPATVLTPDHYEKCMNVLPAISLGRIHMCSRQFKNSKVKPFDLSKLRGYFNQVVLSCLEEEDDFDHGGTIKLGAKRSRTCRGRQRLVISRSGIRVTSRGNKITACGPDYQNLKFGIPGRRPLAVKYIGQQPCLPSLFKINDKIELLCQDSGIRGCWFRCTILEISRKRLKVQYDDVQSEDDCGNLEEWVPSYRLVPSDKLGMRYSGRLTIRPCRPAEDLRDGVFEVGAPVDAWWNDGWWEGVVTEIDNSGNDSVQVYFPGEDTFLTSNRRNLRVSRDWVGDRWVQIEAKPDILTAISTAVSPGVKLSACSTVAKGAESGGSAMSDREVPATHKLDTVEEYNQEPSGSPRSNSTPENSKWANTRKRPLSEDKEKEGDENVAKESKDQEVEDKIDNVNGEKMDLDGEINAAKQETEKLVEAAA
ncbi:hypothetical protein Syun_026790 [Stephania yunnanensis]|uniref:BAH domain-containing protein n=1 Tax=Stephania yunnanensis TaxID=152371 RepID=A0AAP0EEP6_9MAGN